MAEWNGRPENPERHRAHRLRHNTGEERDALWTGDFWMDCAGDFDAAHAARFYTYLGPCITPAEAAAREAAAFKRGAEAAATVAERYPASTHGNMAGNPEEAARDAANEIAAAIRALPIPDGPTLDALLAQARAEEREAIAAEVDCGCAVRAAVLARLETDGEKRASYLCQHGDICCALQAAAIRALPIPDASALEALLAQARAEEREACARLIEARRGTYGTLLDLERTHAAAAIRARGGNDAQG